MGFPEDNTLQIHCIPFLPFPGEEGCIFLHKTLPEGLLLPGDQYIPDPAILIYPSENACGSPQGRLPTALLPGHGLQLTDMAEYAREEINAIGGYYAFGKELVNGDSVFDFDTTKLSVHTHLSECRKPQFLQVRYPEYVHLIS